MKTEAAMSECEDCSGVCIKRQIHLHWRLHRRFYTAEDDGELSSLPRYSSLLIRHLLIDTRGT